MPGVEWDLSRSRAIALLSGLSKKPHPDFSERGGEGVPDVALGGGWFDAGLKTRFPCLLQGFLSLCEAAAGLSPYFFSAIGGDYDVRELGVVGHGGCCEGT